MKTYLDKNVYEAALERIAYCFQEFDNVLVAFSGGKDSGVLLNLVLHLCFVVLQALVEIRQFRRLRQLILSLIESLFDLQ